MLNSRRLFRFKAQQFSLLKRSLTHKIAVVGSGPSGFYTVTELFKHQQRLSQAGPANEPINLEITLLDKYPTPFGLSRYGVAPDHLEVKNCEETFTSLVNQNKSKFNYLGNVTVGRDIRVDDLRSNFNSVVLAYGNTLENKLGIKNEDHPKVINSKKFVAWYNAEPNVLDHFTPPDLSKVQKVVVIGNGNVAMDVARILLMPAESEILTKSDISQSALDSIQNSGIKELDIIARRGILESKFTTKEIRELFQLEEFGVRCKGVFPEALISYIQPFLKKMERANKRKFETILKFLLPQSERKVKYEIPEEVTKQWSLQYLRSPYEIRVDPADPNNLKSIILQKNRIVQDDLTSEAKIEPIENEFEEHETDLIITSVGFKGEPIDADSDIKFDSRRGIVVNSNFKVLSKDDQPIDSLYATGWIANNSKGPILNTLISSTELSDVILKDIIKTQGKFKELPGTDGLELNMDRVTNWKDWETLNEFELKFGELHGKARWKTPTVELMLSIIKSTDPIDVKIEKFKDEILAYK